MSNPNLGQIEACFYRYTSDQRVGQSTNLAETTGELEALKVKGVLHKNMGAESEVGVQLEAEWITGDEPVTTTTPKIAATALLAFPLLTIRTRRPHLRSGMLSMRRE